jgi:predicted dehydrogenase
VRDPNRIQREPEVIHIAFIGAGGIAGTHAGAIDATKIKISAVVDLNPDAARTLAEPHGGKSLRLYRRTARRD